MIKRYLPLMIGTGLVLTTIGKVGAQATSGKVQSPEQVLIQSLEKIETFKAHFSQKIRDANGSVLSQTQGEMMVKRPGKFYWKSQKPDPVLVVADGNFLWTYDIELSQVTKQKMQEALGKSPAALLAGSINQITKDFTIAYAKKNQCAKSAEQCFLLSPKQKDAPFADILLGMAKGAVLEVRMHDPLGQDVHTSFTQAKVNQALNTKLFSFVPPKGVDVIQGN